MQDKTSIVGLKKSINEVHLSTSPTRVLNTLSNQELVTRLEKLAKSEKRIMHLVLVHVVEMESRKLYLKLGYDSMYRYLVQHLGYSEDAAYHRLQGARLLKQNPELTEKIESGSLKLSQLVKVSSAMKQYKKSLEDQYESEDKGQKDLDHQGKIDTCKLFKMLENKTLFETERVLARELNFKPEVQQKMKPQKDESIRLEVTLTKEQYELLQKAQSLMSHSFPDQNLADAITYLAQSYIRKIEGTKKSQMEDSSFKAEVKSKSVVCAETPKHISHKVESTQGFRKKQVKTGVRKRKYISVKLKRQLFKEAHHCCEFVDPNTNLRCGSKYQLQLDHIIPWHVGGKDTASNLRVLCGAHNRG